MIFNFSIEYPTIKERNDHKPNNSIYQKLISCYREKFLLRLYDQWYESIFHTNKNIAMDVIESGQEDDDMQEDSIDTYFKKDSLCTIIIETEVFESGSYE